MEGRRARCLALLALIALCAATGCRDTSGRALAERYCQSCHVLPDPTLLDRATWNRWVLPRMAQRLGLEGIGDSADVVPREGGIAERLVREAGVFPDRPQLSRAAWDRLAAYYLGAAPRALSAPTTGPVTVGLPGFRVRSADYHVNSPMITLVQIDSARGRIYVGDATPRLPTLAVLDASGRATDTFPLPSPVSNLRIVGDTLDLLFMGRLQPSDVPRGALAVISAWPPGGRPTIVWEIDTLSRPVYASYADLSGDGVEDAVVSEFGNLTGRLAWYERLPGGGSRRHLLATQPGALNTVVRDFDGDKRLDVLALTAQGDEGVSLFHGKSDGTFTRERLLRFPPSYGSTSMEFVDVNRDGYADIVYTAGDAGDYPSPVKPYHGIRVFLNDGHGRFAEKYFFPMPGAFKAIARDFDGDGDVDIAAIAFFPDFAAATPLAFVYLENVGGLTFRPWTFAEANRGRWLTMDAGDIDGDGDVDLVLGSFAQLDPLGDEHERSAPWRQPNAPTLLILENTTKSAPPHGRGRR